MSTWKAVVLGAVDTYQAMELVKDLNEGHVARSNVCGYVLEIVGLGSIQANNLVGRYLYCML